MYTYRHTCIYNLYIHVCINVYMQFYTYIYLGLRYLEIFKLDFKFLKQSRILFPGAIEEISAEQGTY